jgi:hypothetical protein
VDDATRLTGRADDAIACIESLSTSTATPTASLGPSQATTSTQPKGRPRAAFHDVDAGLIETIRHGAELTAPIRDDDVGPVLGVDIVDQLRRELAKTMRPAFRRGRATKTGADRRRTRGNNLRALERRM